MSEAVTRDEKGNDHMPESHATPRDTHMQTRLDTHERTQGTQAGPIAAFEQRVAAAQDEARQATDIPDLLAGDPAEEVSRQDLEVLLDRALLRELFEPWPAGRINLRLRCPGCSRGQTSDIIRSGGAVALEGLHSFR